jgi:hypothetical protein
MERTTLEAVASNYTYLRGLLAVPLGMLMILAALGNWAWGPLRHAWVFVACALAVAALALALVRYYNEHYGRITASVRQHARGAFAAVVNLALVLGGSLLLRSDADWSLDMPVNALAAALAAGFLGYYAVTVGVKPHHVVIWASVLVAALLPVWGSLDLSDTSNVGLVLAGVAAMASGVFDHRFLARSFGRAHGLDPKAGDLRA